MFYFHIHFKLIIDTLAEACESSKQGFLKYFVGYVYNSFKVYVNGIRG